MPKLQGNGLYLSALEREHVRILYEETEFDYDAPMADVSIGIAVAQSDKYYEEIQKQIQDGTFIRLGIFLDSGVLIGSIGLQSINKHDRRCTLGMTISKMENQGKGYSKESMRLILKYAFEILGLVRVEAYTYETNPKSQKALANAGFVLEGIRRKAVYFCGRMVDDYCYAMITEDYHKKYKSE